MFAVFLCQSTREVSRRVDSRFLLSFKANFWEAGPFAPFSKQCNTRAGYRCSVIVTTYWLSFYHEGSKPIKETVVSFKHRKVVVIKLFIPRGCPLPEPICRSTCTWVGEIKEQLCDPLESGRSPAAVRFPVEDVKDRKVGTFSSSTAYRILYLCYFALHSLLNGCIHREHRGPVKSYPEKSNVPFSSLIYITWSSTKAYLVSSFKFRDAFSTTMQQAIAS